MSNNQKKQLTKKDKKEVKKNLEEIKESYKLGIKYYENVEDIGVKKLMIECKKYE